jgi:hypothetical protein
VNHWVDPHDGLSLTLINCMVNDLLYPDWFWRHFSCALHVWNDFSMRWCE